MLYPVFVLYVLILKVCGSVRRSLEPYYWLSSHVFRWQLYAPWNLMLWFLVVFVWWGSSGVLCCLSVPAHRFLLFLSEEQFLMYSFCLFKAFVSFVNLLSLFDCEVQFCISLRMRCFNSSFGFVNCICFAFLVCCEVLFWGIIVLPPYFFTVSCAEIWAKSAFLNKESVKTKVEITLSQKARLSCEVVDNKTELKWYKDGKELSFSRVVHMDSKGKIRQLVINSVEKKDAGDVFSICEVGTEKLAFKVQVTVLSA